MRKIHIIFFSIFFTYHLAVLIMVFFINKNAEDIGFLLELHDKISLLFYGAALGLILYFICLGLYYLQKMRYERIISSKDNEVTKLKAELYDYMNEAKKAEALNEVTTSSIEPFSQKEVKEDNENKED